MATSTGADPQRLAERLRAGKAPARHRPNPVVSRRLTTPAHHSPQLPSRPPSTHTPWSGRGSWRPGGARHCTNDLDGLYPDRRLWAWAHMLGFRSKSRRYSTTLGELRQARADFRAAQEREALDTPDFEPDTVLVLADWQYAGHGHTPGESALAATIARDLQLNRDTAREALRDQIAMEGGAA
ncbi:replication initiator [Streptomyces sp. NPDC056656]|uniref:replication initiator n=1 Tax=Streptomyces sp. NPDC056656 TaxID=3345895 RepID=UPI00368F33DB